MSEELLGLLAPDEEDNGRGLGLPLSASHSPLQEWQESLFQMVICGSVLVTLAKSNRIDTASMTFNSNHELLI